MPSGKVHCAISKKRTGFDFADLHHWIDEDNDDLGVDHRKKRHSFNRADAKQIKDYWDKTKGNGWGEKAVVEWLFHIALDNLDTAFKMSKKVYKSNTYNYLEFGFEGKYIHTNFDRLSEEDLEEISDDYESDNIGFNFDWDY